MSYLLSHNTVCKHSPLTYPHASEHIQDTLGNRARFTSIRKPVCYVAPHVDFIELHWSGRRLRSSQSSYLPLLVDWSQHSTRSALEGQIILFLFCNSIVRSTVYIIFWYSKRIDRLFIVYLKFWSNSLVTTC